MSINPGDRRVAAARAKREFAIRQAGQVLADASVVRVGAELVGLSQMSQEDRDWYLSTAKSLIEIYEKTAGITPRAAVATPALALASSPQVLILRHRGRDAALERGHHMGPYSSLDDGSEFSVCRNCHRVVALNLSANPSISGSAINEGCLSAAESRDVRIAKRPRPDAFLSKQPDAGRDGGR